MSERELREAIPKHTCPEPVDCPYCKETWALLSQPPDLVALLRKMQKMYDSMFWGAEAASALYTLMQYIEKTVRLTEDGWEWVEGGD